ncbi:MAG: alpha/beta hydrolase [Chitinophagaceae bacterium]
MKNVYFISGLGATKRSFQFLDLSFCNPVFVGWITPLKKESLPSYATRLRETIPEENPVIVGLSFGGMLAAEMALANPRAQVILISSNRNSTEFPAMLRVGKYLPVYKWLPDLLVKNSKYFFQWIFGAKGKEQQAVQLQILKESDMKFTNAAIDMILRWKTRESAANITHIHGTADKLLPYKKVSPQYTIRGGTHLMVMDNGAEISDILKSLVTGL